jgi:hypothetical protein
VAYNYQYDFGSLVRGDFFMGRSILSEFLKMNPKYANETNIVPE